MEQGPRIGELFDVKFGLKTGDNARFVHAPANPSKHDKPLLRGEDVQRYRINWQGQYVKYRPEEMRKHRSTARPGEAARFEQPKVLVKDTSKRLGCAYDDEGHFAKDVLIIIPRPREPTRYDLRFVTGVINSAAMTFYYRTTFKTLHVQNGKLLNLPFHPLILKTGHRERFTTGSRKRLRCWPTCTLKK